MGLIAILTNFWKFAYPSATTTSDEYKKAILKRQNAFLTICFSSFSMVSVQVETLNECWLCVKCDHPVDVIARTVLPCMGRVFSLLQSQWIAVCVVSGQLELLEPVREVMLWEVMSWQGDEHHEKTHLKVFVVVIPKAQARRSFFGYETDYRI